MCKKPELINDFDKNCSKPVVNVIPGKKVEIVESYKYLGTVFDSIHKILCQHRYQQRNHLLRKLNSFYVRSSSCFISPSSEVFWPFHSFGG